MRKFKQNQYFSFVVFFIIFLLSAGPCLAAFTADDERKVGREIYDKLKNNNFLLQDKRLNDYIAKIGLLVLAQGKKAPFDYTFSIFNSSAINAFATPGGYIYINAGLISAVENEAQLAGVIAHEIAHANARHVASMIKKSRALNIAALAAIIAGAFLGGGGEATAAIAAFSVAGASSLSLKYQREHEEEADRLGIEYLVAAGYYPEAMVEFLKIIKQHEFLSRSIPSYLRTHPGTDDRIFYLDNLIRSHFPDNGASNIVDNFIRMQASIRLDTPDLRRREKQLQETVNKNSANVDLLYALAVTHEQLGQMDTSLDLLTKALALSPRDADVLEKIGLIHLKTGHAQESRTYLKKAAIQAPDRHEINLELGKASYALGLFQEALDAYLKIQDEKLNVPDIDYLIAMAYGKLNNLGESHYHFGLHFQKELKKDSALFHFQRALGFFPPESPRARAIGESIRNLSASGPPKPAVPLKP
jgi:predicted Zn-dependent protease